MQTSVGSGSSGCIYRTPEPDGAESMVRTLLNCFLPVFSIGRSLFQQFCFFFGPLLIKANYYTVSSAW